ncbi:polymorphic toxin type 17 domain-containing protein, partial [Labrenzia sp. C1B70]|uniref:polymorphic toxin type 17 domain-containing protein n=2 Tax=unclassified Labrenzia TaxID=2648686 RepID=UPI00256FC007
MGADGAGPTFGASASVNGAKGSNSSAWVNAPSGIVTDNALNADVGETTSITGGVIASRSGDLTLETERLETADIDLHRKGRQVSGSVGVSIGSNPEGKSKPGITVEGAYSNSETEGVARATIGEGEITVRDGDGDGIKAADLEAEADAAEAEGDTARAEALRTEAELEAAEDTTATETQLSNLNRDPEAVVEVTSQKQEGFELYVSDTSVRDAFKAVKLVGHAASSIVSSVMERMGDENPGLKDLAQAKRAGHLSDEAILTQLAGCNPQHGFNLWQLFVSPAYAQGTCSVTTSNGYVINLSDEETRQCLEIYLGTMIANPEDAGRWADLLRNGNLTAPVRAMGAIAAMSNGPYVTGYGEDGEDLVTTDGNGRFLYKNTVTGDLFFANPLDVGDPAVISYVSDASAVGGPGTSFTTVRLALAPKFVGKTKATKGGYKGPNVDSVPPEQSPYPPGTLSSGKVWTKSARVKEAQLPSSGKIRFVPPEKWDGTTPLPRGPNKGYVDKFGNEWTRGPSRTEGQAFEWDVQLSNTGKSQLGWATRDGSHANVSLDGKREFL